MQPNQTTNTEVLRFSEGVEPTNGACHDASTNGRLSATGALPNGILDQREADGQSCNGEAAPTCAATLKLSEVLGRFEKEAVRGVCDTGRYRCPYFTWGTGPPLVFVHGLCDDAMSFVLPIARLSEHFRCIAYDLPVGRGDRAQLSRYRHGHLVEDLFALLDHLDVPQAYLLGSSFGSTISLAALHRQPRRFARAVLQGGFARRPLAPAEVLLANWARYWPWDLRRMPFRVGVLKQTHSWSFSSCPPERWQFFLDRDGGKPMDAVAHRALILHQTDVRRLLEEIPQPILMVCGEHDTLVGKQCEGELLKGLRNVVRAEIEGCGHMAQFTHAEVLAELVGRFLRA